VQVLRELAAEQECADFENERLPLPSPRESVGPQTGENYVRPCTTVISLYATNMTIQY
jgi:hypothetical protein